MRNKFTILALIMLVFVMLVPACSTPVPFGANNIIYEPGMNLSVNTTDPVQPLSGAPVRYGFMTGLALTNYRAVDNKTTVDFGTYVCTVKVYPANRITVGTPLYYSDTLHGITDTVTSNYFFGMATSTLAQYDNEFAPVIHLISIPQASDPYYD